MFFEWQSIRFRLLICAYDPQVGAWEVRHVDELTKTRKVPTWCFISPAFINGQRLGLGLVVRVARRVPGKGPFNGQHTVSTRSAHGQHVPGKGPFNHGSLDGWRSIRFLLLVCAYDADEPMESF